MTETRRRILGRQRGQSFVEFGMTVGMLMLLVVATGMVAVLIHFRADLQLAASEGAFEGSLVGHRASDAERATNDMWGKLEPGASPAKVTVTTEGRSIVVTSEARAPFFPVSVVVRASHTLERFQPGS